jgi:hypothetical protein
MRFPVVRERVRVQGRTGTFFVLAVHRERNVVDLISTEKGARVEANVPIDSILRLTDGEPHGDRPVNGQAKPGGNRSDPS